MSYLLPPIIDLEKDDYTVTATLASNENPLPSWIQFDSRRFVISPPKGTPPGMILHLISIIGNDFNIKIRIKDSGGLYSDYILYIQVIDSHLLFKDIQNISLISPQSFSLNYKDIFQNSYNYDLNNSISLKTIDGSILPYWIEEFKSEYYLNINTTFSLSETINMDLYFQVIDYWGDIANTTKFKLSIHPNTPPSIINKPSNATFYKGQLAGVIKAPEIMFSDPGDILKIYTSSWAEVDSQSVTTTYDEASKSILVSYPLGFVGVWNFGVVARDSIDNIALFVLRITIAEWAQASWWKCLNNLIQSWSKCEDYHILNLKTGDWVPILSIYSLGSIKFIGMFTFFFLIIHFMVR